MVLDESWGPHTVDRFACHYNTKLGKFNSKYYQPGTSGVNAFNHDWSIELFDEISKRVDYDDYTINDDIFVVLDESWGPHTVDRFACHYNTKLGKFNSKYYQPGTSGVNAFNHDWSI